jgi:hypothetical protein
LTWNPDEHRLAAEIGVALITHENRIYWAGADENGTDFAIRHCVVPGCQDVGAVTLVGGLTIVRDVVVHEDTLIWCEPEKASLFACDLPGCAGGAQPLRTGVSYALTSMAEHEGRLVYNTETTIEACTLPDCSDAAPVAVNQDSPNHVAIGPTVIAWAAGGAIYYVER